MNEVRRVWGAPRALGRLRDVVGSGRSQSSSPLARPNRLLSLLRAVERDLRRPVRDGSLPPSRGRAAEGSDPEEEVPLPKNLDLNG